MIEGVIALFTFQAIILSQVVHYWMLDHSPSQWRASRLCNCDDQSCQGWPRWKQAEGTEYPEPDLLPEMGKRFWSHRHRYGQAQVYYPET